MSTKAKWTLVIVTTLLVIGWFNSRVERRAPQIPTDMPLDTSLADSTTVEDSNAGLSNADEIASLRSKTTVHFVDGSSVEVKNLRFVYWWVQRKGNTVYLSSMESGSYSALKYVATVQNVELVRSAPLEELTSVTFIWRSASLRAVPTATNLRSMYVHYRNGMSDSVSAQSIRNWTPEQLVGDPVFDEGSALLHSFSIEGTGIVEGQEGSFKAYVVCPRRVCKESEAVEDILFPNIPS